MTDRAKLADAIDPRKNAAIIDATQRDTVQHVRNLIAASDALRSTPTSTDRAKLADALYGVYAEHKAYDDCSVAAIKASAKMLKFMVDNGDAIIGALRAMEWRPIETAPKNWVEFLALQDSEIYHCRFDDHDRLAFRTHALWNPTKHRVINAEMDGKPVKAQVLVEEGPETFEHRWTLWTRGFEFAPTHWQPLPTPGDA